MKHITQYPHQREPSGPVTLQKIAGERYDDRSYKTYEAYKDGRHVGYVEQTLCFAWEVTDAYKVPVSRHTTIKAAARVAGRVLS